MSKVYDKVIAAGAGAGGGLVLSTLATWLIGLAFGGSTAAAEVDATLALAPLPLVGVVGLVLTVGGTIAAGYAETETIGRHATPDVRDAPDEYLG